MDELHRRIKEALEFPDYYGENWDAFWDCINRECDVDTVKIVGVSRIPGELQNSVETMLALLEKNRQYWADSDCPFDYEIVS